MALLFDALDEGPDGHIAGPDLEAIRRALETLRYEPVIVEYTGNPAAVLEALLTGSFDLVFNLCEGLSGQAAFEHLPAAAIELLGIPITGARALTLGLCVQKDRTNCLLQGHGIAVPPWTVASTSGVDHDDSDWQDFPAIVKPVAEDASAGIHAHSVVRDRTELTAALRRGSPHWDRMLVQRFVPGREFNLAIVGNEVLPHAEIDFSGLPDAVPPVVTFAAKWEPHTVEYRGTAARCPAVMPDALAEQLATLATRVWRAVDGTGYGRVDVRVDDSGEPLVIDVNPNPDLSPEAGLVRQAAAAGWTYEELIARITADALAGIHPLARERYEQWRPALHEFGHLIPDGTCVRRFGRSRRAGS